MEKKAFLVKKASPLPYVAAALGALMLALFFFAICPVQPAASGFQIPVITWLVRDVYFAAIFDLLLLLSAGTLLFAGIGAVKIHPVFCAVPNLLYTLFLLVWGFIVGVRYLFELPVLLPLILSLAVSVLSLMTALCAIKTKLPLVIVSFAETLLFLLLFFRGAKGYDPGYPPVPFSWGYGLLATFLNLSVYLRVVCLSLGTGLLALSLEYAPVLKPQAIPVPQPVPFSPAVSTASRPAPASVSTEKTAEERLAEIKALLDKGIITQEEFADKRRDILEKL